MELVSEREEEMLQEKLLPINPNRVRVVFGGKYVSERLTSSMKLPSKKEQTVVTTFNFGHLIFHAIFFCST